MRPFLRCNLLFLLLLAAVLTAVEAEKGSTVSDRWRACIADAQNRLSTSLSECKLHKDPKVTTSPVLYLPSGGRCRRRLRASNRSATSRPPPVAPGDSAWVKYGKAR